MEKVLPEIESRNLLEEEIADETTENKMDGENVTDPQRKDTKHNVEVQTNTHARDIKSSRQLDHKRRESEEDMVITNTVCPPPLYYNYFSNSATCLNGPNSGKAGESVHQSSGKSNVTLNAKPVGNDVDFVYYDPGLVQSDGTARLVSVSVQTDEKLPENSLELESNENQGGLIHGLYNLRSLTSNGHLPVLNALLQNCHA